MAPTPSDLALVARAKEFARQYVVLVEALTKQGVPEDAAREEARVTALTLMFEDAAAGAGGPPCPLCGRTQTTPKSEG